MTSTSGASVWALNRQLGGELVDPGQTSVINCYFFFIYCVVVVFSVAECIWNCLYGFYAVAVHVERKASLNVNDIVLSGSFPAK